MDAQRLNFYIDEVSGSIDHLDNLTDLITQAGDNTWQTFLPPEAEDMDIRMLNAFKSELSSIKSNLMAILENKMPE